MKYAILMSVLLGLCGTLFAQDDFEVSEAGILELQSALESGQLTSVELVQKYLDRIDAYDRQGPELNSLVRISPQALQIAAALDQERASSGARGPLHGIPLIIKDNYNTTDMPTTGSSVALAGFVPNANATQLERLMEAGAILLAKSNLHEYAYGITSISSLVGQTRNPYDPRRVPGGSSGGTGAAVAASLAAAGMGSDTCGSIRVPSAFNNLVGLRPSKGLSSIYGVMPLSHTQDVAGPLARNTADLAIILDAVSGYDPRDAATAIMVDRPAPGFFDNLDSESLQGLRLGRLSDYFSRADNAVVDVIDESLEMLEQAGVEIVDIEIPELGQLIARSGLIGYEFRQDINAYLSNFGSDPIHRLADIVDQGLYHEAIRGALVRSRNSELDEEAYQAAYATRTQLRTLLEQVFQEHGLDALVYPPIGELQVYLGESQPGNNCSISANSGLPAVSVPAGFSSSGLPVGLELLGAFLSDSRLVAIAHQIEILTRPRRAPLATPPLVAGRAPLPRLAEWSFNQAGLNLAGNFSYDQTTRKLWYSLRNSSPATGKHDAVTLMVDEQPLGELNDPLIANLLPPAANTAEGQLFVSLELHQAIAEQRLYVRLFAHDLSPSGELLRVDFANQPVP